MKDVTIPPTRGAATRFMISDPVPLDHSIGISPVLIAAKVINFGRNRLAAPSTIASQRRARVNRSFPRLACANAKSR